MRGLERPGEAVKAVEDRRGLERTSPLLHSSQSGDKLVMIIFLLAQSGHPALEFVFGYQEYSRKYFMFPTKDFEQLKETSKRWKWTHKLRSG